MLLSRCIKSLLLGKGGCEKLIYILNYKQYIFFYLMMNLNGVQVDFFKLSFSYF